MSYEPPAAWEDSDDERLTVSLAGDNRFRKLRVAEAEDIVNGTEYIRRLRKQFELLQPTPEWATAVTDGRSAKRRKTGTVDSDEELGSADGMDTDGEEEMALQPLARLLQNTGNLTRGDEQTKTGGKRKLRQEVLDIQRLKDVGGNQPVSLPLPAVKTFAFEFSMFANVSNSHRLTPYLSIRIIRFFFLLDQPRQFFFIISLLTPHRQIPFSHLFMSVAPRSILALLVLRRVIEYSSLEDAASSISGI